MAAECHSQKTFATFFSTRDFCGRKVESVKSSFRIVATIFVALILMSLSGCTKRDALQEAIGNYHWEKAKELINHHPALVFSKDRNGETPLFCAAGSHDKGNKEIVNLLLANKADVNATNRMGQTPLFAAVLGGNSEIVDLLLERGANPNIAGKFGGSPLCAAMMFRHSDALGMAKSLIAHGASVNVKTFDGKTPLYIAARNNHADANSKDEEGKMPLHSAATWGHIDVAELLLANRAEINAKDNQGRTPLALAKYYSNRQFAEWLQ